MELVKKDEANRLRCLEIASRFGANDHTPGDTVKRAEAFYAFLVGSDAGTKLSKVRVRKAK